MTIEAKGEVRYILPLKTGTKGDRSWANQDYVIETESDNPEFRKFFTFNVFGEDKIEKFNLKIGDEIAVTCSVEAKEWNGKWFNQIGAFKVYKSSDSGQTVKGGSIRNVKSGEPDKQPISEVPSDLPF